MSEAAIIPVSDASPEYVLDAVAAAAEWQQLHGDGRATKFHPQVIVKLLTAVREGMHYEPACALAGVTYQSLRNWLAKAEDDGPESPHGRVALALKIAEAEAEGETVRYVRAASRDPRFWAAGMTFLERRHPDRWKRRDDSTVNVNVGVALGVQVSDEQRRQLVPRVDISVLSPTPETPSPLSLPAPIAVSDAQREAKGPPIGGVSPPGVV